VGNIPHIPGVAEPAEPRAYYTITTKYMDSLPPHGRAHLQNEQLGMEARWRAYEVKEKQTRKGNFDKMINRRMRRRKI
jgi:hypothetical protein